MKILVTGLLSYDSGKTEFVRSVSRALKDSGYNVLYFKPVGGHNGWYQLDTIMHSFELKVLVGHDAYIIARELDLLDMVDVLSPIDFLTLPIDPLISGLSSRTYIDYMSTSMKTIVLLRITRGWREDGGFKRSHLYIFCRDTYERMNSFLKETVDELLAVFRGKNSVVVEANTDYVEKILSTPSTYNVSDEILNQLGGYDILFIEGYNNVAAPTYGSLNVDYVFVVAPGKALLYNGGDYRRSVELLSYAGIPWSITTERVVDLLKKPLRVFDLPPFLHDKYNDVIGMIRDLIVKLSEGVE